MKKRRFSPALVSGLVVAVMTMSLFTGLVYASPPSQTDDPPDKLLSDGDCRECHLDVEENWSHSPHAHAYDDPVFQEQWIGLGSPDTCLDGLRSEDMINQWREKKDPIKLLQESLLSDSILTRKDIERIDQEVLEEVARAENFAINSPLPEPDILESSVYSD